MLKIFNTLTRQKEEFKPIHAGEVGMYVCGITVYDLCHIGHGRTFVAFDVVARYLRFLGYKLKYVRNITDIDDKIIKRANENGESFVALVDRMIAEMHKDFDALNILRPDMEPRATHHIATRKQSVSVIIEFHVTIIRFVILCKPLSFPFESLSFVLCRVARVVVGKGACSVAAPACKLVFPVRMAVSVVSAGHQCSR